MNRLNHHLERGLLPESQCGFKQKPKYNRHDLCNSSIYLFISFFFQFSRKVPRTIRGPVLYFCRLNKSIWFCLLWQSVTIMAKFGCPDRFITMVRQFHDGMMARVQDQNGSSIKFSVTNGIKQGCVLAPTLFSIMFSAMLRDAFSKDSTGVGFKSIWWESISPKEVSSKIENLSGNSSGFPVCWRLCSSCWFTGRLATHLFSSAIIWSDHQY